MRIGAIEAGGTKFICGIGDEHGRIEDQISFPTGHPDQTIPQVIDYFRDKGAEAIGIGSFGPIDIRLNSPTYGYITTTPKPGWANYDLLGTLKHAFPVPLGWDTDVNAAAYGEVKWGRPRGCPAACTLPWGRGSVSVSMPGAAGSWSCAS